MDSDCDCSYSDILIACSCYPDVAGDLHIGQVPEFFLVWLWVKLEKPQNCKLEIEDWHMSFFATEFFFFKGRYVDL